VRASSIGRISIEMRPNSCRMMLVRKNGYEIEWDLGRTLNSFMRSTHRESGRLRLFYLSIAATLLVCVLFFCLAGASSAAGSGSILIVAPHPDDDLLYGAGVEMAALNTGRSSKVVYVTNGDVNSVIEGLERQNEAVRAQSIIGPVEDELIFLGYPDGYLTYLLRDYTDPTDAFIAPNGQSSTYGDRGLGGCDYHTHLFGTPALYNGANVVGDLTALLEAYRPGDIYTTSEFDGHSDHRATYRFIVAAIAAVHASDSTYSPTVHKTIVWWNDGNQWPQAMDPQTPFEEISGLSSTGLIWSARESLVVPDSMQSTNLSANPKYRAINAHVTQGGASGFLGRFIHQDEIFWVEGSGNHAPTANAGPDQAVLTNASVTLDGSGSSDPDGNPLTYQWTQTAGPTVTLSSTTIAKPTFTAPASATSLTFSLVVSDGQLSSTADTVTITVQAPSTLANIASLATVTASSQDTSTSQLAIRAVDGVVSGYPADYTKEWATIGGRAGSWIRLTWSSAQLVSKIVLYDRPNTNDQITAATIRFSDGTTLNTGTLPDDSTALTLTFPARSVTYVELYINTVKSTTENIGLAEIEVWAAW
jgi:LmbE family N-acetylglucosaminyl deacetylase